MGLQQELIWHRSKLYPHYFLCHYRPVAAGKNSISHSLLRFKLGNELDLAGWIDCATAHLSDTLGSLPPASLILRALHHDETTVPRQPIALDSLGHALAIHFNAVYHPECLQKPHPSTRLSELTVTERTRELAGSYTIAPDCTHLLQSAPAILLIDDVLTTATTMKTILDTIYPYTLPDIPIFIFTLAKTAASSTPSGTTSLHGRHYLLTPSGAWTFMPKPNPATGTISNISPQVNGSESSDQATPSND